MKNCHLLVCFFWTIVLPGQDKEGSTKPIAPPVNFTSTGSVSVGGKNINYEAIAQPSFDKLAADIRVFLSE